MICLVTRKWVIQYEISQNGTLHSQQCSAAMKLRWGERVHSTWGERVNSTYVRWSCLIIMVKKLLNWSTETKDITKIYVAQFFWNTIYMSKMYLMHKTSLRWLNQMWAHSVIKLSEVGLTEGKTAEEIWQRRRVKRRKCAFKEEWLWLPGVLHQEALQQCYCCTGSVQGWWTMQHARSDQLIAKVLVIFCESVENYYFYSCCNKRICASFKESKLVWSPTI